jgi:FAD:protein FMN transferase
MELHRRNFLGKLVPKSQPTASDFSPEPGQAKQEGYLLEVSRKAMGCQFAIYFPAGSEASGTAEALRALDQVERLERLLSIYREDSIISRINQSEPLTDTPVDPEVSALLLRALDLSVKTCGAFDITAGSLIELWGFHRKQARIPAAIDIAKAIAGVGVTQLKVDAPRNIAMRCKAKTKLDLGAIGKGYAIDQAASVLREGGLQNFLLHGGTSTVWGNGSQNCQQSTSISPPSEDSQPEPKGWLVDIRHPLFPQRLLAQIRLHDRSLSTSGSAVQSFFYQGKRYGHIIDPRTGYPADQVISTTVLAPSAALSDALATAFFILGPLASQPILAEMADISAVFVTPGEHAGTVDLQIYGPESDIIMS